MALSVGRGVAGLRTVEAMPTETLDIPKLCLTGRAPPRGAKVELSNDQLQSNLEHWPSFHNGVAAGEHWPIRARLHKRMTNQRQVFSNIDQSQSSILILSIIVSQV